MAVVSAEDAVAKSQMLHRLRKDESRRAHDGAVMAKAQARQSRTRQEKAEKAERVEKVMKTQRKLEKKFKGVAVSYGKFAMLESSDDEAYHGRSDKEEQETFHVAKPVTKKFVEKQIRKSKNSQPAKSLPKRSPVWTGLTYFAVGIGLGLGALAGRGWLGF